jgi:hypothetical protein
LIPARIPNAEPGGESGQRPSLLEDEAVLGFTQEQVAQVIKDARDMAELELYDVFALTGELAVLFLALLGLTVMLSVVLDRGFAPACRQILRTARRAFPVRVAKRSRKPAAVLAAAKPNGKTATA